MESNEASDVYQRGKNRLFFIGLFAEIGVLLFIFFSGLTFSLKTFSSQFSVNFLFVNGIYLFILSFILYAVHFPFGVFSGFFWEHKFKLSTQKFGSWLLDDLKKSALGFLMILLLVEVIYFLLGRYPRTWWIGAGCFWLFLTFILAKLTPNVIIPLFYKYIPVKDQALREQIFQLFKSCDVRLKDVYAFDLSSKTKKANAFFCGIGKNRRVVLSDTLLANFSAPEIVTVVAHELGHYKHRDIIKLLFVNTLVIFIGFFLVNHYIHYGVAHFGLTRIDDIAFFPVVAVMFTLFGFCVTPLVNAYSRAVEVDADKFSLEVTKKPEDFISVMRKLCAINMAQWKPDRLTELFFYDHPPVYRRVEFAEKFQLSH